MNDRINEIAGAYAANVREVDKLAAAIADLVRDEREACAKLAESLSDEIGGEIADAIRARKP